MDNVTLVNVVLALVVWLTCQPKDKYLELGPCAAGDAYE